MSDAKQYQVGDKLVTTGQEIKFIVGQTAKAGVYITKENNVRYEYYAADAVPARLEAAIAKFSQLAYYVKASVPPNALDTPRLQLATALNNALNSPATGNPLEAFKDVELEVLTIAKVHSSFRYLAGSLVLLGVIALLIPVPRVLVPADYYLLPYGAFAGGFGALLSVIVRTHSLSLQRIAPLWAAGLQGATRILMGAAFGVVMVVAIKTNIILGVVSATPLGVMAGSVVGGFSERLVPELLTNLADRARQELHSG